MPERPVEILLVQPDADLAEMIERQLITAMSSRVTVASSAADALREELTARHDLVVVDLDLAHADGLSLIREIRRHNDCPVILVADGVSLDQAIDAMRLGVVDVLQKPFDLAQLSSLAQRAAEKEMQKRRDAARHRRLRRIASRVIRERQDLNQRMDLLCRDFVHAYRRLAEKLSANNPLPHSFSESQSS